MIYENNNRPSLFWQVVLLIGIFVTLGAIVVTCGINVRLALSGPPVPIAPAPTATLSPLFAVLAEQAKTQTRVTVVTTEADSGVGLGWYAIPVGLILTGLGVGYLGVRYGRQ